MTIFLSFFNNPSIRYSIRY